MGGVGTWIIPLEVEYLVGELFVWLDDLLGRGWGLAGQQLGARALLEGAADGSLGVGPPQRLPRFRTSNVLQKYIGTYL